MSEEVTNQQEGGYMSIVVDTLNSLQNDAYVQHMKEKGNPNFNEWRDYGVELLDLYNFIKSLNGDIVQILGREGTGKTVGAWTLNPAETLYLNGDNKPLTFPDAHLMYNSERKNLKIVSNYTQVKDFIKVVVEKKLNPKAKGRVTVFILAHIEEFKASNAERERLRVLGKVATKLNIEGSVIHTYYTWVDPDISKPDEERYKLLTRNTGLNTGRTPMRMWTEDKIPNDFQLILNKIIERR